MKKFIVGKADSGKPTLTVQFQDLPFNVFSELGRLAGLSYRTIAGETFEFLLPNNVEKGKQILIGAMFKEESSKMPDLNEIIADQMLEEDRIKNS